MKLEYLLIGLAITVPGIFLNILIEQITQKYKPVINGVPPRVEVYEKKKKRYQKISA